MTFFYWVPIFLIRVLQDIFQNIISIVVLKITFPTITIANFERAWNVGFIGIARPISSDFRRSIFLARLSSLPRKHQWRSHHWNGRSYGPTMFQVLSSCLDEKRRDKLARANEKVRERKKERKRFVGKARVGLWSICIQQSAKETPIELRWNVKW